MNSNSEQKLIINKYSAQFKDQAVERAEKDGVPQVAKDLGIAEAMLYSWRSKKKQGGNTRTSEASASRNGAIKA